MKYDLKAREFSLGADCHHTASDLSLYDVQILVGYFLVNGVHVILFTVTVIDAANA